MSGKSIFLNSRFSAAVSDRGRKEKRWLSTQHQMWYLLYHIWKRVWRKKRFFCLRRRQLRWLKKLKWMGCICIISCYSRKWCLYVKEPGKCSLYISRSIAELRVEMFMRFLQIPYSMQADMAKSQSSFWRNSRYSSMIQRIIK